MSESLEEEYKNQISIAWKKYEEKNSKGAKELCLQNKNKYPNKIGANYLLGIINFDEKEFEASIDELKTALKKDDEKKSGGFINYWIAKNYGEKTYSFENENPIYNKELARISYEKSLEYESYPDDVINQLNYIYQNDFKLINLFKKAVKKFPDDINFYLSLSFAYSKVGQIDDQEKILLQASEKIESSHISFELGQLSLKKKNYKVARDYFQVAEKLNDNKSSEFALQVMIANTYREEGELDKAKKIYTEAFKKERNNDNFWFGLIGILVCGEDSNFTSLLATMEVTKQFIIDDWFGEMPIYLDSQRAFGIDLPGSEKDLIKKINVLKKSLTNEDVLGKLELIKYSLHKHIGERPQRLKSLKESIKYLNTYHYDFILNELGESYSDMFYHLVEENKPIDKLIKEITSTLKEKYSFREVFVEYLESIIEELHKQKKYKEVINIYEILTKQQADKADIWFEVGFAFNELENFEKAKYSYNRHIEIKGENSAVLNNLANIFKRENKLDKAIDMYHKALTIEKDDDITKNNLENALQRQKEISKEADKKKALDKLFRGAVGLLKSENYFVLESLNSFILNSKKEEEFDNWNLPIQEEMFPILLRTNSRKAFELKENWLSKNYIILTDDSDEYDITYYHINPYLEKEVNRLRDIVIETNLPKEWIIGVNNISTFQLDEIDYSATIKRISKVNIKYRPLIIRDYNELVFNYLIGNRKTIVVLSGSFVELILTYFCERKKVRNITYLNTKGKLINKKLYDCVLFDLISFIDEKKFFGSDFFPLTNLSRVYRNFVHPGVELKNSLDKTKSDLCFISSVEILRKIV
jgi:tetratricopeptide (TPR) repeat protein